MSRSSSTKETSSRSTPATGSTSPGSAERGGMDVEKLRAILAALQGTEVTRLDWTNGQERLTLRMGHPPAPAPAALPTPPHVTPIVPLTPVPAPAAAPAARDNTFTVNSPFVGTFYRAA